MSDLIVGVNASSDRLHSAVFRFENNNIEVLREVRIDEPVRLGDEKHVVSRIEVAINKTLALVQIPMRDISAVGISTPGLVDSKNGIIKHCNNLGIREFPIVEKVRDSFSPNTKVVALNNVQAHAIGEHRAGAGRGSLHMFYVYVGRGVTGAIIVNGKLYTGASYYGGDIGHSSINFTGQRCDCGNIGCLEAYASRKIISRNLIKRWRHRRENTVLSDHVSLETIEDIPIQITNDAIRRGDSYVEREVLQATQALGAAIGNVINLLNPEIIVLGGELMQESDFMYTEALKWAPFYSGRAAYEVTKIVRCELGTTAAAYGAAVFSQEFEV